MTTSIIVVIINVIVLIFGIFITRPHHMHHVSVAACCRSRTFCAVCVGQTGEPYKNSWTNRDVI